MVAWRRRSESARVASGRGRGEGQRSSEPSSSWTRPTKRSRSRPLGELAGGGHGDLVDELDPLGQPPLGELVGHRGHHLGLADLRAGLADDHGQGALAPPLVGDGDDRRLGDLGVAHQGVLQLDAGDPLAAGLDQVLGPVDHVQVAVVVEGGHVAGVVPAVHEGLGRALVVQVLRGDGGAAQLELAHGLAVGRDLAAVAVHHPLLQPGHEQALLGLVAVAGLDRQVVHGRLEPREVGHRGRLGHAVGVDELDPVALLVGPDHRHRGRPTRRTGSAPASPGRRRRPPAAGGCRARPSAPRPTRSRPRSG
jgi:hypothetical protein